MMDRWDPLIWNEVGRDREAFARVKAFILVESAGMQYAVSRTGCSGLTQFCLGTARSGGFKKIFGLGQLYPCGCRGACRVPRTMRQALESGDPERISGQGAGFPCDLTDARFNPRKSIAAGWLYIRRLSRSVGGNLYLMYIGYNSGPAVARRIHASLKANKDTDLAEIAPLLPGALRPYFGNKADSRARSLVKIHLPKLRRAYDAYRVAGPRGPR